MFQGLLNNRISRIQVKYFYGLFEQLFQLFKGNYNIGEKNNILTLPLYMGFLLNEY